MAKNRDDFSEPTKRNLARRVNYKCSMPECGNPTEGPHTDKDKYLSVGVAAHISAASEGGPRYDKNLTEVQRKDIENGIWLCETHAKLIDKDPDRYPVELLNEWKKQAEAKALAELEGKAVNEPKPFLEAELRFSIGGQIVVRNNFFETKKKYGNKTISPFDMIRDYRQEWKYEIVIYNNSQQPAYNVNVENKSNFTYIEPLPKVNNIPPLSSIKISGQFEKQFTGTGKESNAIIADFVPKELLETELILNYYDEERELCQTKISIDENGFNNEKIK